MKLYTTHNPDKIIQEQKSKIEELTKKLSKLSKISKLNEIAKLEEKSIEESELISKPTSELKGLTWIIEKLKELSKYEYTYDELKNIFEPLFKEHNLKWDKNTSIKIFFPEFEKTVLLCINLNKRKMPALTQSRH